MRNKVKKLLKSNVGFSQTVEVLFGSLILLMIVAIIIAVFGAVKTQTTLDSFADEMALKISMVGKCEDDEISGRYEQLVTATGLTPTIEVWADEYRPGTGKPVQYGEPIYLKIILDVKEIGLGNFKIPFGKPMECTRICQSEQYWK